MSSKRDANPDSKAGRIRLRQNTNQQVQPALNVSQQVQPAPNVSQQVQPAPNVSQQVQPVPNISQQVQPVPNISQQVQPVPNVSQQVQQEQNISQHPQPAQGAVQAPVGSIRWQDLDADAYNIHHAQMGKAVIVNNKYFTCHHDIRVGSEVDVASVHQCLSSLGFDVYKTLIDAKKEDILKTYQEVGEMDHSDSDCFISVFMSHGDQKGVYAVDELIEMKELTKFLSPSQCPSLVNKPKIFVTQACRGQSGDPGALFSIQPDTAVKDRTVADYPDDGDVPAGLERQYQTLGDIVTLPNDMDFLMVYSSIDGHYAYRNTETGTPFIQKLAEELETVCNTAGGEDITSLLHRVNKRMAIEFTSSNPEPGMKQMPCFVSMLTKKFVLKQKS